MIIVSQNKKRIVNFENVDYLEIYHDRDGAYIGVNFSNPYSDFFGIGEYATKERAKEVLEEIAYIYSQIGIEFPMCNGGTQQRLPVYYMPKE